MLKVRFYYYSFLLDFNAAGLDSIAGQKLSV